MENENKNEILTIPRIMELYGLSRKKTTELLNMPGCPILPRHKGQHFLIYRPAFEKWLMRENIALQRVKK